MAHASSSPGSYKWDRAQTRRRAVTKGFLPTVSLITTASHSKELFPFQSWKGKCGSRMSGERVVVGVTKNSKNIHSDRTDSCTVYTLVLGHRTFVLCMKTLKVPKRHRLLHGLIVDLLALYVQQHYGNLSQKGLFYSEAVPFIIFSVPWTPQRVHSPIK